MNSAFRRVLAATLAAASGGASAACGGRPAGEHPAPAGSGGCVVAGGGAARDTVAVALSAPFQLERIGQPADEAERTLIRNVYETLLRVDCRGEPVAGLAASWQVDDAGTVWTFVLRGDARFQDGAPLTARDVAAAWSDVAGPRRVETRGARAMVRSVEVAGDGVLVVTLDRRASAAKFADPALAVLRHNPAGGWPIGSGPYAVNAGVRPGRGGFTSVHATRSPDAGTGGPAVLHFAVPQGADLRNALDFGVDVVLTRNPAVLAYASAIPGVTTAPLVWDRTYLLLAPAATGAGEAPPAAALDGLARDAIRTEARPAARCAAGNAVAGPARVPVVPDSQPRILYIARDEAARGVAERLAALAGQRSAEPWVALRLPAGRSPIAVPTDATSFERALREGRDAAYIVAAPSAEACDGAALAARAPWIAGAAAAAITPLLESRPRAILRPGVGPVVVEGDGALRFDRVQSPPPR